MKQFKFGFVYHGLERELSITSDAGCVVFFGVDKSQIGQCLAQFLQSKKSVWRT